MAEALALRGLAEGPVGADSRRLCCREMAEVQEEAHTHHCVLAASCPRTLAEVLEEARIREEPRSMMRVDVFEMDYLPRERQSVGLDILAAVRAAVDTSRPCWSTSRLMIGVEGWRRGSSVDGERDNALTTM